MTIEEKAVNTILEVGQEINVGGRTYLVPPPTPATLILVSKEIAKLPGVKNDKGRILYETLAIARDCEPLGRIVAIMILGAKRVRKAKKVRTGFFSRLHLAPGKTELDVLSKEILEGYTPRDLATIVGQLLATLQVGDFFGISASLAEINLIRAAE